MAVAMESRFRHAYIRRVLFYFWSYTSPGDKQSSHHPAKCECSKCRHSSNKQLLYHVI